MININLSQEDIKNLYVFLNRVQLQGSEAVALVKIMQKIEESIKEKEGIKEIK